MMCLDAQMARIFLAPYISPLLESGEDGGCSKPFSRLHEALLRQEWPYDYGDDPAFFSDRQLKRGLTWGVCRADVRSQIQTGDAVVFFSFTNRGIGTKYKLCAVATVERKIAHSDIFLRPAYKSYRNYLNLLVRPSDSGRLWTHHEPGAPKGKWHKDWLGRVAPHRVYPIEELKRLGRSDEIRVGSVIDGRPFRFGENYVIFSRDVGLTGIVQRPPTVADAKQLQAETWRRDRLSQEIFCRTVGVAQYHGIHRSLRIKNKTQHSHSPPIRWEVPTEELSKWRAKFLQFLKTEALLR
jgi:hypothetical protein